MRNVGDKAERIAIKYLKKQGLRLVSRNYSWSGGELDAIMLDDSCLVFVEVRYRKNDDYGGAAASVSSAKQRKLMRTAEHFMSNPQNLTGIDNQGCRFDIITLSGPLNKPQLGWLKNAISNE